MYVCVFAHMCMHTCMWRPEATLSTALWAPSTILLYFIGDRVHY